MVSATSRIRNKHMTTITSIQLEIERLKLLKNTDNDYNNHSWYEAEIEALMMKLKPLLKK